MCTTQYIYQTLFVEQRNSDIAVHALGKVWNLHKIYLCQSPYFASLFSGAWRERSSDRLANVEIVDPLITLEGSCCVYAPLVWSELIMTWSAGLETVFGSLYNNEVLIDPKRVVSVLATATLFQLDGLIERCGEVMTETIMAEVSAVHRASSVPNNVDRLVFRPTRHRPSSATTRRPAPMDCAPCNRPHSAGCWSTCSATTRSIRNGCATSASS